MTLVVCLSGGFVHAQQRGAVATGALPTGEQRSVPNQAGSIQRVIGSGSSAGGPGQSPDGGQGSWAIVTADGRPLRPMAVAASGRDLYFLGKAAVWKVSGGGDLLKSPGTLVSSRLAPTGGKVTGVPVQEFCNFVVSQDRASVVVLDKSGDIFELSLSGNTWRAFRPNRPMTGQPDPDFVDIAAVRGGKVCALDPERNQIWKFPSPAGADRMFAEVLPWKIKRGDANVTDGLGVTFDVYAYVLKHNGNITRYGDRTAGGFARSVPFHWRRPKDARPSRIMTGTQTPLYVVERENNRVLAIDKRTGQYKQFIFPASSDLRGLLPGPDRFFVIDGDRLLVRLLSESDSPLARPNRRSIDPRLDGLVLPIEGARLPRHPGVWPGARRLYRYGVHKGVDFFHDPACKVKVVMGTPVRAADGGKVIRADVNFRDMDAVKFSKVMRQCRLEHATSDTNEDLFRGCQVWIDHGNGLMTRYAHLDSVKVGLAEGTYVSRGDVIGGVGVSGTGQNLPRRVKHPHLHFEIWLDGKYLGSGLTPAETIGLFEDIFGTACERGNS